MDQKPKGPYKHVERPSESRVSSHDNDNNMGSSRWGAVIIILIVIIIALIPIVYKFSSDRAKNQAQPVQTETVKKTSSVKKTVKPKKKSKKKKSAISSSNDATQSSTSKTSSSSINESNSSSSDTPKTYVVQDGDTLSSIAADHGMSVSSLAELNDLDSDSGVEAGQTLKLQDEQ